MVTLRVREVRGHVDFANARSQWTERRSLIVELRDGRRVGRGEAAPLPGYSKESLEECRIALEEGALEEGAQLPPAAEFALESARAELEGRAGVSGHGPLATATLDAKAPAAAWKCKIGRDLKTELALAKKQHRPVRFDANGTLGPGAKSTLESLAALAPEFVEEPVPFAELAALNPSPVPIALDESLHTEDACERLTLALTNGWAHVVVIKPMALGPTLARKLCEIAAEFGVPHIVSHLFGGPLAYAATARFAFLHGSHHPHGLGRHGALTAYKGYSTTLGSGGIIEPWEGEDWPVRYPEDE